MKEGKIRLIREVQIDLKNISVVRDVKAKSVGVSLVPHQKGPPIVFPVDAALIARFRKVLDEAEATMKDFESKK